MKNRKFFRFAILFLAVAMCFFVTGCKQDAEEDDTSPGPESAAFDIDGDGLAEACVIESEKSSAAAYFLHVTDSETGDTETFCLQLHEYSTLLFKTDKDGHVYLYGETPDSSPVKHRLEISIVGDGFLTLSENGETVNWHTH